MKHYREAYSVISIVYRSLQADRQQADITDILRQLQGIVDTAITPQASTAPAAPPAPYDMCKINFDRLKQEFARSPHKKTLVQNLKEAVEKRLARMLAHPPLRTNFQEHYEKLLEAYNREKDRVTIERTFEDLLNIVKDLGEEQDRAAREGLDEESLAVFDLLKKPQLTRQEIARIKAIARELLDVLKQDKLRMDHWTEKESTRDDVHSVIHDYLYSDSTGLPEAYTTTEIQERAESVFLHVVRNYPELPSPTYGAVS